MRADEIKAICRQRTISRHSDEASRFPFDGQERRIISGQFQNKASLTRNLLLTAVYERDPDIQQAAAEALAFAAAEQEVVQELFQLFREAGNDHLVRENIASTLMEIAEVGGLREENIPDLKEAMEKETHRTIRLYLNYAYASVKEKSERPLEIA